MTGAMHRILVTGGSGFIGSHFDAWATGAGHEVINLDLVAPADARASDWIECDIRDPDALRRVFAAIAPTRVLHLAARANLVGKTLDDFPENVAGTANVVECINQTDEVELFVNTSTQYVVTPGTSPRDIDRWQPYTAYGASKAEAERIVLDRCRKPWITARPTNIWGPGHPFFPVELWRYLERRWYLHPGREPIRKYYGYVGNAVRQFGQLLLGDPDVSRHGAVWYISDPPIDNALWMDAFSRALSGKPIRRLPLAAWKLMAAAGDLLGTVGMRAPVNSQRLFRLTVNEVIPAEMIVNLPESQRQSLDEGVAESVAWYRRHVA